MQNVSTLLDKINVYTHASYAHAAEQVAKISEFRQKAGSNKDKYQADLSAAGAVVG